MPVAGNRQPYGLLHGGASVVLAETLGSFGAALHAGPERIAVGIEISATHHRSATSGHVTGYGDADQPRAHPARPTRSSSSDDEGRRVCTSRLTCLLRDRPSA